MSGAPGSPRGIRAAVAAARRRVLRDGAWAAAAAALLVVPLVLAAAWCLGGAPAWAAPSAVPLALELGGLAAALALGGWLTRRWILRYDEARAAAAAERTLGLPDGSVRGVLELGRSVPDGTSPALFRHAEAHLEPYLADRSPAALAGEDARISGRRRWRALGGLAGATLAVVVLGFVSPARMRAAWAPLAHPVSNLRPPPMPPLQVRPGNARVPRGAALDVAIVAPLRRWVQVHWRAPGDVPRTRDLEVLSDAARTRIGAIDAPTSYWVTAPDGASSDTFRILPVDPLLVSDLSLELRYPAYLGREPDRYAGDVPALQLPAGTEVRIRGRGTRALASARLVAQTGGRQVVLQTDADRFAAVWTPTASGRYDWVLRDRFGGGLAAPPAPLDLTVVPDSAPRVEVVVPATDTTLAADMQQPVAASARDDHGLRSATLVSWRASTLGERDAPLEQALPLGGATDRATLQAVLDATSRRLLPGDTLYFYVRVTDNSPARQAGVSRTVSLRLPGMEELRLQAARQAEQMLSDASALTRGSEGLQQDTRNLALETAADNARNASRGGGSPDGRGGGLSYDRSEQARQLLERHDAMMQRIETLQAQAARLEKALRGAGLADPELQARLQELQRLYDQILTPEMRQKLDDLREALARQDPAAVQKALEQLSGQQDALRQQLDRSLQLMRRAAAEQQMNALAEQARELATQQQALAEALQQQSPDSTAGARRQAAELARQLAELAARADSLAAAVDAMRQQLEKQGEAQAARQTAQAGGQTDRAHQQMEQAARQAAQQAQRAGQQGEQAADSLSAAARTLEQTRQQMAQAWKQETQQALQQATSEALSLAQREAALARQMKQMQENPGGESPQQILQQQPTGAQSGQPQDASGSSGAQAPTPNASAQQQGAQNGGQQDPQQGGSRSGDRQGPGKQGQSGEQGGQRAAGQPQPNGRGSLEALKSEQQALQQSLQQLGQNLSRAGEKTALMNRDVGNALARAMLAMQQTLQTMEQRGADRDPPSQQADETVDALNRLALSLATSGQQVGGSDSGTGVPQALQQQLSDLARSQGSVNGRTSALVPLALAPTAMSQQMQGLAAQEKSIAQKLGGMAARGGQDALLGRLDELARQADQLARALSGGRITADMMRQQQVLFHRLLDAGRTLQNNEVSDKRVAERPGDVGATFGKTLDPALLRSGLRYPVPTAEQLSGLPPAYRRLVIEYFDRLNRAAADSAAPAGRDSAATVP